MGIVGASLLPDGVRGEDRGEVTVAESFEAGDVTERPVDPADTVQLGELDRFGHLHLDPRRARRGGFDEPHSCAVTERQELGFGSVAWSWFAGQRAGRSCRVVGVIDARVAWRGPQVAGNLNRSWRGDVGSRRSRRRRREPTPPDRSACARPAIPATCPVETVFSLSVNQYVGTPPNARIDRSRHAITVGNVLSHTAITTRNLDQASHAQKR